MKTPAAPTITPSMTATIHSVLDVTSNAFVLWLTEGKGLSPSTALTYDRGYRRLRRAVPDMSDLKIFEHLATLAARQRVSQETAFNAYIEWRCRTLPADVLDAIRAFPRERLFDLCTARWSHFVWEPLAPGYTAAADAGWRWLGLHLPLEKFLKPIQSLLHWGGWTEAEAPHGLVLPREPRGVSPISARFLIPIVEAPSARAASATSTSTTSARVAS